MNYQTVPPEQLRDGRNKRREEFPLGMPRTFYGGPIALAYAAGIFDGEGSIGIYRRAGRWPTLALIITVASTDPRVPSFMRSVLGVGTIAHREPRTRNRQASYYWRAVSLSAAGALHRLAPFLMVKQRQCNFALQFQSLMGEKHTSDERYRLMLEIKKLNSGKGRRRAA